LILDRAAQRLFERTCGFPRRLVSRIGEVGRAIDGMAVKVLCGVGSVLGYATGLFLGVAECAREVGARGTGLWHDGPQQWLTGDRLPTNAWKREKVHFARQFGSNGGGPKPAKFLGRMEL